MERRCALTSRSQSCSHFMRNQHWIIGIPSTTELNFQHVCMLDLYIPYTQALLFFLPAWHISLYFCSDVPYLQFPLRVSVSHVKSLVVSGSDGVSRFLLQSVSAPPKTTNTNSFTVFSFQGSLFPFFYCKTSLNTILLNLAPKVFQLSAS